MPLPDGRPTASERAASVASGSNGQGYGDSRYQLSPQSFAHAKAAVVAASRRSRRKALALGAQVTYLAVMDPESGASTQDRLKAADGAARVSGLTRDDQVKVTVTFTMRGWGSPPSKVIDATPVPPLADGARGEGG